MVRDDDSSEEMRRVRRDTPITEFLRQVLIPALEREDPGGAISVSQRAGLAKNWCAAFKARSIKKATIEAAASLAQLHGWDFRRLVDEAYRWAERESPGLLDAHKASSRPPAPPEAAPNPAELSELRQRLASIEQKLNEPTFWKATKYPPSEKIRTSPPTHGRERPQKSRHPKPSR